MREREVLGEPLPGASPSISAGHHGAGILVKRSENRSEEEIQTLKRLKTIHRITERCCSTLFEEFAGMLRNEGQTSEEQGRRRLEEWAGRAKVSGIAELGAFAVKLLQDTDAVVWPH